MGVPLSGWSPMSLRSARYAGSFQRSRTASDHQQSTTDHRRWQAVGGLQLAPDPLPVRIVHLVRRGTDPEHQPRQLKFFSIGTSSLVYGFDRLRYTSIHSCARMSLAAYAGRKPSPEPSGPSHQPPGTPNPFIESAPRPRSTPAPTALSRCSKPLANAYSPSWSPATAMYGPASVSQTSPQQPHKRCSLGSHRTGTAPNSVL